MPNNRGTRAANGEGYIGKTIQKIDRKHNRLDFVCDICKNCNDWSICNYREGTKKCQKCLECDKCLTKGFCDRFYCREMVQAQISIDGNQVSVASKRTRKESVAEKKKKEANVENGTYVKKCNKTLYHFCKEVEKEKRASNTIGTNTVNRNKATFCKLKTAPFFPKPIQKISKEEMQDFLNIYTYLSQSEIDKLVSLISSGFEKAVDDDVIAYKNNFMRKFSTPLSEKQEKDVVAFELNEFIKLLKYILTTKRLIINSKSNYDDRTIRNLIILSFLSLTRIGELGALDLDKHINLDLKYITIERTLTKDENGEIIIGTTTKTGKRQKKVARRNINFNLFSEELYELVLLDQIENAKNNKNNSENLLFCDKDGCYLRESSITSIFKRICREAGVKLELITGCFIHMTRHTGISFMICMRL